MEGDQRTALAAWLDRLRLRAQLDSADAQQILTLPGRVQQIASRHDFVKLGERAEQVFLVINGLVGQFGQTREGIRQLVALRFSGDVANLSAAVLPDACCAETAIGSVLVYAIPRSAILALASASSQLAIALWTATAAETAIAEQWIVNLGRRNATVRLAHLLCELAMRLGGAAAPQLRFNPGMTQTDLADALGLTSVHVNRTLRNLKNAGLVSWSGREVLILDWQRLVNEGDFDPAYLHLRSVI